MMAFNFLGRRIFTKNRNILLSSIRSNGYIVLVPEIGEDLSEKNPLVQNNGLPEFNKLTIENCMAAVAKQTLEFESGVKQIETDLVNRKSIDVFEDIFKPLEELGTRLDMTWGLSKTLYLGNSTLMPTKSYLAIHDRAKRARAAKFNSQIIYQRIKTDLEQKGSQYTDEQLRILKKFCLEGKLNGLELNQDDRQLLVECLNKIATARMHFKERIEIATKQFSYKIGDGTIVRDFPVDLLKLTAPNPNNPLKGPWTVTLQSNIYFPVLENCPEREIRWNIWQAFVSRGSGYADKDLATSVFLEEIRFIRRDMAKLLGFQTFADMSMETKMAGSVDKVKSVLGTLRKSAKPAHEKELDDLYKFALERGFKGARIELWDLPFWRKKQQNSLYEFKEDIFKGYFPLKRVLEGLFGLCEKLFNIIIKQRTNISAWHKDVQYFDIFESHSSAPTAGLYIDAYARSEEKNRIQHNKGWMVGIQSQSKIRNNKPLAALIFNFDAPDNGAPSYLSFKEVYYLFHKFGLALQHLLAKTNYSEVSGFSNIEWDAVEVSGHVLSNLLYTKTTIDSISCHYDNGDSLPQNMFETLINVRKHMSGTDLSQELYLSALDIELHCTKDYWLDVVKELWPQYQSFPLEKIDSHPCSFLPIFLEEWGAAYYSHIWSRMVAADVYSAFAEVIKDEKKVADVGRRYRDTFLALGGSCHPSQVFRKFRGRDPSPTALLRSLGIKQIEDKDN